MEKNIYTISYKIPTNHLIDITYRMTGLSGETTRVQLPVWRPGRYELGNFAKNIQRFEVKDKTGKALPFRKITSHLWEIVLNGNTEADCVYTYYGADLNAGSTYLNAHQLYMNPVNCLMYQVDRLGHPCEVNLQIPENYRIASSLPVKGTTLFASDCHELFDSPYIASPTINSHDFFVHGVKVFVHFQGVCKPDFVKLEEDFARFFGHQVELFGDFPTPEYHFLFQILPNSFHHGVEHQSCTVIAMGPGHNQFSTRYREFLGISSHELFHAWNIKAIRPAEMMPYDYTKENYTNLGYVSEGVTTLMGDLTLLRSGVWTPDDFVDELSRECQKHFDNFGRFNHSVSQSSFDSWLDGYNAGIPHRKVSIYTEGMLLAFVCEMMLCKATDFTYSLYDVMHSLYHNYYKKGKGYTEADYQKELEHFSGISFQDFFKNYVWQATDDQGIFEEALSIIGLKLDVIPSHFFPERSVGIKITSTGLITSIYPGSAAEKSGLWLDDRIVAINGVETASETGGWMDFFKDNEMLVSVWRLHHLVDVPLRIDGNTYFKSYRIKHKEHYPSANMEKWIGMKRHEGK